MNTSDRGALTELVVAVDLMWRGYEVFRALSPASSCDLVICKGKGILRVEVKTDRRTGRYQTKKGLTVQADIVAIPMEGFIAYYPPLRNPPPDYPYEYQPEKAAGKP